MGEQRTPLAGLGVVVRRAADELVPAIGFLVVGCCIVLKVMLYQSGLAGD